MKYLIILAQIVKPDDLPNLPKGTVNDNTFQSALQLVFGLAGAVAVLIITIAGFKYVLSQGDPQKTAQAKDTIMYALIGLAVCIFAFSIVSFIIPRISQ